jgi:hypothetical protein
LRRVLALSGQKFGFWRQLRLRPTLRATIDDRESGHRGFPMTGRHRDAIAANPFNLCA